MEEPDTDQLTLGNLGIRCFNSLAACLKLALSGYYQAATLHIRDLLEVAFLLDHFSTNPALVTEWRTLPERDRERKFSALAIRQALDKREDRKRVVEGKSVSVRVDLGGRRKIKKKKYKDQSNTRF